MPLANQADLHINGPRLIQLSTSFDDKGYERGERINGACQCPECGLWWPVIEEPDVWTESDDGRWIATGWWGEARCELCHLLMIDQPGGRGECYRL